MERTEVVATNQKIALHAKRKELALALELFERLHSAGAANSHTYASMINAAVQCGDMAVAEEVVQKMRANGRKLHREVVLCTTLMKGYCNDGQLNKALTLFREMVERNHADNKPNIRTVNTILRGCLQNGSVEDGEATFTIMQKVLNLDGDSSAWETLIALQCQNLDLEKVLPTVGRIKSDPKMESGLLRIFLSIARAAALLGESKTKNKFIKLAEESLSASAKLADPAAAEGELISELLSSQTVTNAQKTITGGKRAWKSIGNDSVESTDEMRNQSLALYRRHITLEAESDLALLKIFRSLESGWPSFDALSTSLSRLLSLPTESLAAAKEKGLTLGDVVFQAWLDRYGLQAWTKRLTKKSVAQLLDSQKESAAAAAAVQSISQSIAEKLYQLQAQARRYFDNDHRLCLPALFPTSSSSSSSSAGTTSQVSPCYKLEVCSGSGEWACTQAQHDRSNFWFTLEVRQDRTYYTFARATMLGLSNLAILGGDALQIIPHHFSRDCLQQVCVNYPEPPQQRAEQEASEARHLLTARFFDEAWRILRPGGQLTILTDNLWYAKLVARLLSEHRPGSWKSVVQRIHTAVSQGKKKYFDEVESEDVEETEEKEKGTDSGRGDLAKESPLGSPWSVLQSFGGDIILYEGEPGPQAGHVVQASSYFDRMWQRSEQRARYFISVYKVEGIQSSAGISRSVSSPSPESALKSPGKIDRRAAREVHKASKRTADSSQLDKPKDQTNTSKRQRRSLGHGDERRRAEPRQPLRKR